jgi:SpoVK/Ycf46/Vps4 family AAA+-type ATPase
VLARSLALPLYRVDLAAIASKYIGETEKNLSALFERAALFFDEADALFGKRSDVRDSHDRYAMPRSMTCCSGSRLLRAC